MCWEPDTLAQGTLVRAQGLVTLWSEPPCTCREKVAQEMKEGVGRRAGESQVLVSGAFSCLVGFLGGLTMFLPFDAMRSLLPLTHASLSGVFITAILKTSIETQISQMKTHSSMLSVLGAGSLND